MTGLGLDLFDPAGEISAVMRGIPMGKEHARSQFDVELNEVRLRLLEMGGKVELMIANSMKSLLERDSALAEQTIASDKEINAMEVEIDRKCLHILARRQPAARDLRFMTLALKIVTDLERIGDQCVGIAGLALELNSEAQLKPYVDLPRMADTANDVLREALDAFVQGDAPAAENVCRTGRILDELNEQLQRELLTFMMEDAATIGRAMRIISISKYLARIADHATNIAEMVIFLVIGKDIRHSIGMGAPAVVGFPVAWRTPSPLRGGLPAQPTGHDRVCEQRHMVCNLGDEFDLVTKL